MSARTIRIYAARLARLEVQLARATSEGERAACLRGIEFLRSQIAFLSR